MQLTKRTWSRLWRELEGLIDFQAKLNKMDMERMVLTNLAPDFFGIKTIVQRRISFRSVWSKVAVNKVKKQTNKQTLQNYAALKEIELMGI